MKKTHVAAFLSQKLIDLLHGTSTFVFLTVIILFVIFLTELMSNTATIALLAPILFLTTQTLGKPVPMFLIPTTIAASCAFMLPIATPPNAMIYGTGKIKQQDMMRTGIVLNIVFIGVLSIYFTYVTI